MVTKTTVYVTNVFLIWTFITSIFLAALPTYANSIPITPLDETNSKKLSESETLDGFLASTNSTVITTTSFDSTATITATITSTISILSLSTELELPSTVSATTGSWKSSWKWPNFCRSRELNSLNHEEASPNYGYDIEPNILMNNDADPISLANARKPLADMERFGSNQIGPDIIPGRYIVEFKRPENDRVKRSSGGDDVTTEFIQALKRSGFESVTPVHIYSSDRKSNSIFSGMSFQLGPQNLTPKDQEMVIAQIQSIPKVSCVWPVRMYHLLSLDVPKAPVGYNLNTGLGDHYPIWNPHYMTGVDKLQKRGLTGKGVTVGVIDTGTFYLDSALGGGIGPGKKVVGGWNFMGDIYDPRFENPKYAIQNDNPLDCNGHGTHCAGIIAGSNNTFFTGVAPNANIRSYKIFGCSGGAPNDAIVGALLRAYDDDVDIVSLSLGSAGDPFTENPEGMVIDRLVNKGIFAAIAAGNSGTQGPFYGSALATNEFGTTVGSTTTGQNIGYEGFAKSSNGEGVLFTFITTLSVQPDVIGTYSLRVFNETACKLAGKIPYNIKNQNIALLFPQGDCKNQEFFLAIKNLGYNVVLNYQDKPGVIPSYTYPGGSLTYPVKLRGTTDNVLANWAQRQVANGQKIELVFDKSSLVPRLVLNPLEYDGIQLSSFTTWGPNFSGGLYPHIAAPGSTIFSTYLNGSYAVLSGTSMATPYIAGVAALYLESVGGRKNSTIYGKEIRRRMIQTSSLMKMNTFDGVYPSKQRAPLIQQGAGLINATNLVDSKTIITSDTILDLGLGTSFNKYFNITIFNGNNHPVTYNLSHTPAATVLTKRPDDVYFTYFPPFLSKSVDIHFNQSTFTIPPNTNYTAHLVIEIPKTVPEIYSPVYQGRISIDSVFNDHISLPYIGTYTNTHRIWGNYPPILLSSKNATDPIIVVKDKNDTVSDNGYSFIAFNMLSGARVLDLLLVNETFEIAPNFTFPLEIGKNGVVAPLDHSPYSRIGRFPDGIPISFGFADNVTVPSGIYKLLIMGLPAVPNKQADEVTSTDFETFITPAFTYIPFNTTVSNDTLSSQPLENTVMNANETNSFGLQFVDAEITSLNSNSTIGLFPFDSFGVNIKLRTNTTLVEGKKIKMQLPLEFSGFPAPFLLYNNEARPIINVTISNDTNILTAEVINSWLATQITGSIYFTTMLKNPEKYEHEQQLVLKFQPENDTSIVALLNLAPIDLFFPSSNSRVYSNHSTVDVYLPESFSDWRNLRVRIATRYNIDCLGIQTSFTHNLRDYQKARFTPYKQDTLPPACHGILGNNGAMVEFVGRPKIRGSMKVTFPIKTSGFVRNSPVLIHLSGTVFGEEFNYYFTDSLNNAYIHGNGFSLSGKQGK